MNRGLLHFEEGHRYVTVRDGLWHTQVIGSRMANLQSI